MGHQEEPGDLHGQELPEAGHRADLEALQRGQRRVVRLQDAERGQIDPRHHPPHGALGQEGGQRLHLGQLGHATSLPHAGHPFGRVQPSPPGADALRARKTARIPSSDPRPEDLATVAHAYSPSTAAQAATALQPPVRSRVAALVTTFALVLAVLVTGAASAPRPAPTRSRARSPPR